MVELDQFPTRSQNATLRALSDAYVAFTKARLAPFGHPGHPGAKSVWIVPINRKKKPKENLPLLAEYPGYLWIKGTSYGLQLFAMPDDEWLIHIDYLPDDDAIDRLMQKPPWNDPAIIDEWTRAVAAHRAKWRAHPSQGHNPKTGAASNWREKTAHEGDRYVAFDRESA